MISIAIAILLQAAAPTAEAETLGRRLADSGTLATLLPLMSAKETEEMVAAHPDLSAAEQANLRETAKAIAIKSSTVLLAAEGHAYAAALSLADLRVLAAATASDAAKRQRAALPKVIMATMQSADGIDFKRETLAAFCKKTGKACAK